MHQQAGLFRHQTCGTSPRRNQAHVNAPNHTSQTTDQVPTLNALDERKVDQADQGPQLQACNENGYELELTPVDDRPPVNLAVVNGATREEVGARVLRR